MSGSRSAAVARSTVGATVTLDRARIRWRQGLRTGLVVLLIVVAGLNWTSPSAVVAMALGGAFVGIADTPDPNRNRLLGLALTLLALAAGALTGSMLADSPVVRVAGSAAVALVCGFVGVLGPRAALAGVMTLALTTIYAGTPGDLEQGAEAAAWVLVGGIVYLAAIAPDWPLRTMQGLRGTMATAYRAIGLAGQRADHSISATGLAMLPAAAHHLVERGDTRGATRQWAENLIDDAEKARRGLIALGTEETAAADDLRRRAAEVARRIADALDLPLRQRRLQMAAAQLATASATALTAGVPRALVTAVTDPLERAAQLTADPWPTRGRAETGPPAPLAVSPWRQLRSSVTAKNLFARHAVRLALAIAVATVVGELLAGEPGYWVALTVAWISKPDLAGTVGRVVLRLGGTLAGVAVTAGAALVFTGDLWFALVIAIGAFTVTAFLLANYAVAVIGITTFVIMLFDLTGEPVRAVAGWRILDTLIAGVIALAAALILPNATGSTVHQDLSQLARRGAEYSDAVFAGSPDAMTVCREAVLGARLKAESAALAAAQEPVAHDLDPDVALAVMADLRLVSAQLLRWDELLGSVSPPPELAAQSHSGLMALADRLADPRTPSTPWRLPATAGAAELDLLGPIASAHARLSGERLIPPATAGPM